MRGEDFTHSIDQTISYWDIANAFGYLACIDNMDWF